MTQALAWDRRWSLQPGDRPQVDHRIPPAVEAALHHCPTCGQEWPATIHPAERTTCK